ncbi:orphan sodium- and chloride-dependent neurotransmitter transporter NTT5-like [Dugong dugon]
MASLEEISDTPDEELSRKYEPSNLKEIRTAKTQNSFAETKKTENILIQVAFSVGLGSIWRFPYMCHQNGGGSFILMYFFMLLLVGTPLLYMEMVMGQWLRVDNIRVWKQLVPWLGGVGYTSMLVNEGPSQEPSQLTPCGLQVCFLVSLCNSVIISWSLSYLGHSFHHSLPWNQCPLVKSSNETDFSCLQTVPYQYFWYNTALNASGNIEEGVEALVLNLTLGIFAAWFLLFIIMISELKISVSMLIFSVFLPYIILFCLLIRSLFLEGASVSLKRVVTTELSALASLDLWRQAGGHVLYSLSLGMGTVITFSSYKAQGNVQDYFQVAFMVILVNLLTSLLSTAIVFLVLGFWATTSGPACIEKSISNLMNLISEGVLPQEARPPKNILLLQSLDYLDWISNIPQNLQYQIIQLTPPCSIKTQKEKFMEGPGLVFVAFSQVISLFPGAPFWAIIFFLALLITGLGTLIRILEGVALPLQNAIPIFRKHPKLLSGIMDSVSSQNPALQHPLPSQPAPNLLGSLQPLAQPYTWTSFYIMSLFDEHLVSLVLVIVVTFQNVALAWIYGASRFREEMFIELGRLVWSIFTFLWCYVTLPGLLALLTICFMQLYQKAPPYYIAWNASGSQEVKLPYLPSSLNWLTLILIFILLPIPALPLHHWWNLQDPTPSDPIEKTLPFKKVSLKPLPWQTQPMGNANVTPQDTVSEDSSMEPNLDSLWQFNFPQSKNSLVSSWFSLPLAASQLSILSVRSVSPSLSRQVSPANRTVDNSNLCREATEGNLHSKSAK